MRRLTTHYFLGQTQTSVEAIVLNFLTKLWQGYVLLTLHEKVIYLMYYLHGFQNASALSLIEVKSLLGSNTSIWKHATKVMHVDVFIPDHFYADLWFDVIHENMAEERILDICSISLIDVGDNLPCVRKNDVHNVTYLEDPQYIQVYNNEEYLLQKHCVFLLK